MRLKLLCVLGAFLFLLSAEQLNTVSAAPHFDTAYDIINGVNDVRASYGLPPLEINNNLMAAAQAHSNYQASIGSITHTGEGGSTPSGRAAASGYGGGASISVTENIFGGAGATAVIAVSWWASDPPHLQTLIGPYKHIGAGMAVKNGVTYYTLDVGYISGDPGIGAGSPSGSGTGSGTAASPPTGGNGAAPFVVATPREDGSIIHIVGFGQTLWTISILYEITVEELMTFNNLTESSIIYPGDELIIKPPINGPTFTPSGPTLTPKPTTPTVTPTPTIPPTRTPRPTRTLAPTDEVAVAQVFATSSPSSQTVNSPSEPSFRNMAQILIVVLLVLAGGLVLVGNVFDRSRQKE
jgi:uncharacterized protein YkwD